jgi:hypothetical protein
MIDFESGKIETESVRIALEQAWKDHHHCRDQTWRALQMELVIIAALIAINFQIENLSVILITAALAVLLSVCGIQITIRHRNNVECLKFVHITNCSKALGLMRDELISGTGLPKEISIFDAFNPTKANTSLFILRMHIAIFVFSSIYFIWVLNSKLFA